MYNENYSELNSYQEVEAYFSRARNPEKGRPFRNWGMINKNQAMSGVSYAVKFRWAHSKEDTICNIYPNNTIEFVYPKDCISWHGTTLVGSFTRGLPMVFTRVKTGKYRLTHSKVARDYYDKVTDEADKHNKKLDHNNEHISTHPDWRYAWSEYYRWLRNTPNQEYFEGITFDLVTGKCINPRDDLQVEINQENKKEWLRTVKKFKKGLRLRAKTQVFTSLVDDAVKVRQKARQENIYNREKVDLSESNNVDWIVHCMREDKYPIELLKAMVDYMYDYYQGYYYWEIKVYNHKEIIGNINKIFNKLSVPLREKFNVFKGDIRP